MDFAVEKKGMLAAQNGDDSSSSSSGCKKALVLHGEICPSSSCCVSTRQDKSFGDLTKDKKGDDQSFFVVSHTDSRLIKVVSLCSCNETLLAVFTYSFIINYSLVKVKCR